MLFILDIDMLIKGKIYNYVSITYESSYDSAILLFSFFFFISQRFYYLFMIIFLLNVGKFFW